MENCKKQLEKDTSWDILRFFPFFPSYFCTSMVGNRWLYQMIPTCDGWPCLPGEDFACCYGRSAELIGLQHFGSESADPQMAILISNMVINHIIHGQIFGTLLRISWISDRLRSSEWFIFVNIFWASLALKIFRLLCTGFRSWRDPKTWHVVVVVGCLLLFVVVVVSKRSHDTSAEDVRLVSLPCNLRLTGLLAACETPFVDQGSSS